MVSLVGYAIAAAICVWIYRAERHKLSSSQAFALVFLIFLTNAVVNHIHSFNVDHGTTYSVGNSSNGGWQDNMENAVIQLSPDALPHSYRFLPNCLVRWMQLGGLGYEPARDIYRLVFGLLLFYALYRYSRLYTDYAGGVMTMLLVAMIFPVSFELYAGQVTDPLSHLSFILAFIFLETDEFALLLTTLVIGSLAKETVLAVTGYYLLFYWKEKGFGFKAAVLCLASAFAYFGVRLFVLHGNMHYRQVSGVSLNHVWINWTDYNWPFRFLLTAVALFPFLLLGWKTTPLSLKRTVFYWLPILSISGLFFSWLHETRNFMPLVFVLAVVTARYFETFFRTGFRATGYSRLLGG